MQKKFIEELDGLRFCAAMWIFLGHFGDRMVDDIGFGPLKVFSLRGNAALTAFFLIGGFILQVSYGKKDFNPPNVKRNFYVARFARIGPSYYLALVLSSPFLYYEIIDYPVWFNIVGMLSVPLAMHCWIPFMRNYWHPFSWAISTFSFYWLVFPWLGPFVQRIGDKSTKHIVLGLVLSYVVSMLIFIPGLWVDWHTNFSSASNQWGNFFRGFPPARIPTFMIGMFAALLYKQTALPSYKIWWVLTDLSALSIVLLSALIPRSSETSSRKGEEFLWDNLLSPIYACLLIGLASGKGLLSWLFKTKVMRTLGLWSFSIYIYSGPLALIDLMSPNVMPSAVYYFILLSVTIGYAGLMNKVLENPLREWIIKRYSKEIPKNDVLPTTENTPLDQKNEKLNVDQ